MKPRYPKSRPLTDQEEREIQAKIAADPDAPEATDAQIAQAKPFADALPGLAQSIKRSRGRPRTGHAREVVTLRLSSQTIERYKAAGDDWRARMSDALEKAAPNG